MPCERCHSEESADFPAQVTIYLDASRKATPVALNAAITVCFTCGYAGISVHDEELQILKQAPGE